MRFAATGLAALFTLSPLTTALAETRYISDVLVVDLRTEPSASSPTTRFLRTGDAMEVLDAEGSFFKVRADDGTVGWVIQQYTTTETPKAQVIARLNAEVSRLKKRALEAEDSAARFQADAEEVRGSQAETSRRLELALDEARTAAATARKQLGELRAKYEQLVQTSQDAVQTAKDRDRLEAEHRRMTETVRRLEQERDQMMRSYAIQWFLAGAGVLLVGWLMGASFRRKKKSGYSIS